MVTTSYPRFPGRQHRHVHGADRERARGTGPRGTHRRAVAPGDHARHAKRTASLSTSSVRAAPRSTCSATRKDARRRRAARGGVDGRAARAGRRHSRQCAPVARNGARRSCTAIGSCLAARLRLSPRPALPLVVSLHGSDVFVAERVALAGTSQARVRRARGYRLQRRSGERAIGLGADAARWSSFPTASTPVSSAPDDERAPAGRALLGRRRRCAAGLRDRPVREEKGFRISDRRRAVAARATPVVLAIAGTATSRRSSAIARLGGRCGGPRPLPRLTAAGAGALALAAADVAVVPVHPRRRRQRRWAAQRRPGGFGLGHPGRRHAGRRHRAR